MKPTLHHIGILVADITASAEGYIQRLGYRIVSDIIHDPVQTAHVCFLAGDVSDALVELVAPDGPESKLTNALKKGGGLNHLCYSTGNIEADILSLRSNGMFVLQTPVAAQAFPGRRIAWLIGKDGIPIELVEQGTDCWLTTATSV